MNSGTPGIVLVGYRATGKSTVGRILADTLGKPFADADREVEILVGRSIRSIFLEDGEAAFRDREAQVIDDLSTRLAGGVLATGGGAILLESNRKRLKEFGLVVWLTADAETLARRLQSSRRGLEDRPALTSAGTLAEIADVLNVRTPLYQDVAHSNVSTEGKTAEQVAFSVLEAWDRYLASISSGVDR